MFENEKLQKTGFFSKVGVFFVLAFTLIPLIWVFLFSFKNNLEIMLEPFALPKSFDFGNYVKAFVSIPFGTMIKNSGLIILIALPCQLVFSSAAAFAISRLKVVNKKFRDFMESYFISGLIVPGCVMLFPIYKMMLSVNLWNTLWGVILPFIGWSAPLSISILVNAFDSVPNSLEEAGILDGCNILQLVWHVMLPLVRSALTTVAILQFLGMWNDFLLSQVMLNGREVRTISLASMYFKTMYGQDYGMMAAGVTIMVIPQLILFLFVQKYIVAGVSAGAVKE